MPKVTITVSGPTKSGKSLIKYQIATYLKNIGLDITVIEDEMNDNAIMDRIDNPSKYVKALNENGVKIEIVEKSPNRSFA